MSWLFIIPNPWLLLVEAGIELIEYKSKQILWDLKSFLKENWSLQRPKSWRRAELLVHVLQEFAPKYYLLKLLDPCNSLKIACELSTLDISLLFSSKVLCRSPLSITPNIGITQRPVPEGKNEYTPVFPQVCLSETVGEGITVLWALGTSLIWFILCYLWDY